MTEPEALARLRAKLSGEPWEDELLTPGLPPDRYWQVAIRTTTGGILTGAAAATADAATGAALDRLDPDGTLPVVEIITTLIPDPGERNHR